MQNQGDPEASPDPGDRRSAVPGRGLPRSSFVLLAGTIIFGAAAGWFFAPHGPAAPPAIEMVASANFTEAMKTLSPEAAQQAQADPRECRVQMGYVTVSTPGNPAGGTVRFRTASYQSPPFAVTDKPQRIAIPNMYPGTGGIGSLSVDGEAKGLVVALTPPARMEPVNGTASVDVIFPPTPVCKP